MNDLTTIKSYLQECIDKQQYIHPHHIANTSMNKLLICIYEWLLCQNKFAEYYIWTVMFALDAIIASKFNTVTVDNLKTLTHDQLVKASYPKFTSDEDICNNICHVANTLLYISGVKHYNFSAIDNL